MIYCFGNSHVSIFNGSDYLTPVWPKKNAYFNKTLVEVRDRLPWFRTINIGAATAYQAEKHFKTIQNILTTLPEFDKKEDTLLLVFGEVDIRQHVYQQSRQQNRVLPDIVKEVARRYLTAVLGLVEKEFKIALYGCSGSWLMKNLIILNKHGTVKNRNKATFVFNNCLKEFCEQHSIPYVSVFNESVDKNWMTDIRYMDAGVLGEGSGLHITTKMLPLLLWKCRDVGLIPFEDSLLSCEKGSYKLGGLKWTGVQT